MTSPSEVRAWQTLPGVQPEPPTDLPALSVVQGGLVIGYLNANGFLDYLRSVDKAISRRKIECVHAFVTLLVLGAAVCMGLALAIGLAVGWAGFILLAPFLFAVGVTLSVHASAKRNLVALTAKRAELADALSESSAGVQLLELLRLLASTPAKMQP